MEINIDGQYNSLKAFKTFVVQNNISKRVIKWSNNNFAVA